VVSGRFSQVGYGVAAFIRYLDVCVSVYVSDLNLAISFPYTLVVTHVMVTIETSAIMTADLWFSVVVENTRK